jgi:hypothetical protein
MPPLLPDNLPPAPPPFNPDDPLDFQPVPRRVNRPDGWTAERQREFIRRLAVHGSPQQACLEMGKNVTGIEAVYKVPTAHSFRAAWDHAVSIGLEAQGRGGGPLHLGPVPGIHRRGQTGKPPPPPADGEEDEMTVEQKGALLDNLLGRWLGKVEAERIARLAGRITEADFYLRQVTFIEICFGLMCGGPHDAWMELGNRRHHGESLFFIAETPFSQVLDTKRRDLWAILDQPDRPEHPPARFLVDRRVFSIEPFEVVHGGEQGDKDREHHAAQYAEDAKRQVEWEAQARRDYERRRDSGAAS